MLKHFFKQGESLIEVLLVVSLLALFLPALFTGFMTSIEGKPQQNQRLIATGVLKETEEAVRSIRDKNWTSFAVNGTFHPVISASNWNTAPGSETLANGITRQFVISDVYRDATGKIVLDPAQGTVDASTKKVVITVSWTTPYSSNITSTLYLTRHENLTYIQTTKAEFDAGIKTNTFTTLTQDGEVVLGAGGGGGNWCTPSQSITTVDLSRQGIPTYISAAEGKVITGTGGNASGPTFARVNIVGNTPPQASITGTFDNNKANGVFTDTSPSNYAYLATTNHSQEIMILDTSQFSDPPTNSKFQQVGYFDAPGNGAGNAIFVSGNVGYMTSGSNFYTFDASSKSGSRPRLGNYTLTLAGTGTKIIVVGNYAYVAVASATTQLQVIDVSNPSNPTIVAQANVNNNQQGVDVAVNNSGTRAYLVTTYVSGKQDFFVIDTSTKSGNLPLIGTGYNTNGMNPKGVAVTTGNRVIIVGTGGTQQYQVVKIDTETNPTSCSGLAITNGAFAVSTVLQSDGYAYSYIVTGDTNAELKIILGGGGGLYNATGTFESSIYDNTTKTAFNNFTADVSQPSSTSITMQVAVAAPGSNGCSNAAFYYVGPQGDPAQKFLYDATTSTIHSTIPLTTVNTYTNPGQCFRYKVWFQTSDSSATPVFYKMTVNYSP